MTHKRIFQAVLATLAVSASVQAEVDYLQPAWARPTNNTQATAIKATYQYFDAFDDDDAQTPSIQDAMPDISINPNGNTSVAESAGSFITSTGNIYSPFARLNLNVSIPGYVPTAGASTKFLVQIETLGSELVRTSTSPLTYDFSAFKINGTPISTLRGFKYAEISRGGREDGQGDDTRHAFTFTLPTTASTYQFAYRPLTTSSSQSAISVDTFVAIPGDFNYDGKRDVKDIDLLLRATPGSTLGAPAAADSLFDVTLDDNVTTAANVAGSDADAWVTSLAQTRYGDANLDKHVNFDDLIVLAQNYNKPATSWAQADFNGSGTINFDDLVLLAQNYNFGAGAVSADGFAADWALAQSLVPEPTIVASIAAIGGLVARRRRTHR